MTRRENNAVMPLPRAAPLWPLRRHASHSALQSSSYAVPYRVFDRNVKRLQRDSAARRESGERSRVVDYVRDEVANRMMERFMVGLWLSNLKLDLFHPGYQTQF